MRVKTALNRLHWAMFYTSAAQTELAGLELAPQRLDFAYKQLQAAFRLLCTQYAISEQAAHASYQHKRPASSA